MQWRILNLLLCCWPEDLENQEDSGAPSTNHKLPSITVNGHSVLQNQNHQTFTARNHFTMRQVCLNARIPDIRAPLFLLFFGGARYVENHVLTPVASSHLGSVHMSLLMRWCAAAQIVWDENGCIEFFSDPIFLSISPNLDSFLRRVFCEPATFKMTDQNVFSPTQSNLP